MDQNEPMIFYQNLHFISDNTGLSMKEIARRCKMNYQTLMSCKFRNTDLYYRKGDMFSTSLGIPKEILFHESLEGRKSEEVHMFASKKYYYELLTDNRCNGVDFHETLNEICNILHRCYATLYMDEGMIKVESHYEEYYSSPNTAVSTSIIRINPNADSQRLIRREQDWALNDEEELIFYLVKQINLHFPILKELRVYKEIFLYHFIKKESFTTMKHKKHYRASYKKFLLDCEETLEYAKDAFRLWSDMSWYDERVNISENLKN